MQRYGFVIGVRPERLQEYKDVHARVWPGVLEKIRDCNIRNYSIFLKEPENFLFGYYEYHGTDHDRDMDRMAADPETQDWWALCKPMQKPFETRKDGEWWAAMDHIFLLEDQGL